MAAQYGGPGLFWGTLNLAILLVRAAPNHWTKEQAEKLDAAQTRLGLLVCLAFGLAFLVVRVFEFGSLNCRWDSNAYGSIVWVTLGSTRLTWQLAYLLVYVGCHRQNLLALYVETAVALLAMAGVWYVAWRSLQAFPDASRFGGQADDRSRFMALAGVGLSSLFLLVVPGAAIPRLLLDPCP